MLTEPATRLPTDSIDPQLETIRLRWEPPRELRVKVFADGADLANMRQLALDPVIQGFTTNPSLMRQSGIRDYQAFARQAREAVGEKPIAFEVLADGDDIRRQARIIAEWGDNVYVKVPIMNSAGRPFTDAIHDLSHQGVKVNVTAVFTLEQVMEACSALHGGAPSVVSVFAGRIADAGYDPVPRMVAALRICRAVDPTIELLWASSREVLNVVQANEIGVDIITVTESIRTKLHMIGKDLLQLSKETVQNFKRDAESAGFEL